MAGKRIENHLQRAATLAARFALAFALALTLGLVALPHAQAQETAPTLPERDEIARPVRSTLIALDQATRTGHYTVLPDRGAPCFRDANARAKLPATSPPTPARCWTR